MILDDNKHITDFDDFDFGFDKNEDLDGISFDFKCKFKIVEYIDSYSMMITQLYKTSYKEKREMEVVINNFPMSISEINGIEISDFQTDKIYVGEFIINYYDNGTFDIFLKQIFDQSV